MRLYLFYFLNAKPRMNTNYSEGDFSFILDKFHRYLIEDGYKAVTQAELWDFIKNEYDAKKALDQPEIMDIFLAMKYKSHTMKTFGVVMRNIKKIAADGWEAYVKEWIATKIDDLAS